MNFQRILIVILIALTVLFLGLQISSREADAAGIRAMMALGLTILYYVNVKKKNKLFLGFLLLFSFAEILNYIGWKIPVVANQKIDYFYFVVNSVYISAYAFLIVKILASMVLKEVIRKYPFHILILVVLDVFSVVIVTNTTLHRLNLYEYSIELVYNSVIMILLTVALMNFVYQDDKKSINFLLGSIFLFFSEVIQLAYFYVSNINMLNIVCSVFMVLAFLFFYLQSQMSHERVENSHQDILV